MVEEGQQIRARPPTPPLSGNDRRKTYFFCEVFSNSIISAIEITLISASLRSEVLPQEAKQ